MQNVSGLINTNLLSMTAFSPHTYQLSLKVFVSDPFERLPNKGAFQEQGWTRTQLQNGYVLKEASTASSLVFQTSSFIVPLQCRRDLILNLVTSILTLSQRPEGLPEAQTWISSGLWVKTSIWLGKVPACLAREGSCLPHPEPTYWSLSAITVPWNLKGLLYFPSISTPLDSKNHMPRRCLQTCEYKTTIGRWNCLASSPCIEPLDIHNKSTVEIIITHSFKKEGTEPHQLNHSDPPGPRTHHICGLTFSTEPPKFNREEGIYTWDFLLFGSALEALPPTLIMVFPFRCTVANICYICLPPPGCNLITVFLWKFPLSILSPWGLLSRTHPPPRLGVSTRIDQSKHLLTWPKRQVQGLAVNPSPNPVWCPLEESTEKEELSLS